MILCWVIGLLCLIVGVSMIYFSVKKISIPHDKHVYENSNEYGIVALASWKEVVDFKKREAKKEVYEAALVVPGIISLSIGVFMIVIAALI